MSEQGSNKTVYFVRHGQSIDNITLTFPSLDSPLSEQGLVQAINVANRLHKVSCEALVTSPYRRAKQTADTIARNRQIEPEYSELFVERMQPTSIEGVPYQDRRADAVWREWERSLYTPGIRTEDGENFDDLIIRADKALTFLLLRPEKTLVVVTHGYFLRTMVSRVLMGNLLTPDLLRNFQLHAEHQNTAITVIRHHAGFEQEPSWHLWIYNDHSHLE